MAADRKAAGHGLSRTKGLVAGRTNNDGIPPNSGLRGMQVMRKPVSNPEHRLEGGKSLSTLATAADDAALEKFGVWLDGELEKLVARWVHLAAPNAAHRERSVRRMI